MAPHLQIVQQVNRSMQCSSCGAAGIAACDCGAPYVLASSRAAKAIADNPRKSDRAIAAEIGVSAPTVGKARRATVNNFTVDTRVGRDGKVRQMPKRKPKPDDDVIPTEEEADESYQQHLYEMFCDYLTDMTAQTRRKLFAHIRRKYRDEI